MAICSEGICIKYVVLVSGEFDDRAKLASAVSKDGLGSKVFINITHCKEIDPASTEAAVDSNGKKGQRWRLPFTLAPKVEIVEDHAGEQVKASC